MKAKLIKEATEFRRGQSPKSSLDIGIERSDNPNNLANSNSLYVKKTNEEVLEEIIDNLSELHKSMDFDLNPDRFDDTKDGKSRYKSHPKDNIILEKIINIEKEIIDLINILRSIKR